MSEQKNMGIGPLADKKNVFARKFRYTLVADHWGDEKISTTSAL